MFVQSLRQPLRGDFSPLKKGSPEVACCPMVNSSLHRKILIESDCWIAVHMKKNGDIRISQGSSGLQSLPIDDMWQLWRFWQSSSKMFLDLPKQSKIGNGNLLFFTGNLQETPIHLKHSRTDEEKCTIQLSAKTTLQ